MNKQLVLITSPRNFARLFDALHAVLILVKLLTLPVNDMQLSGRRWRSKSVESAIL